MAGEKSRFSDEKPVFSFLEELVFRRKEQKPEFHLENWVWWKTWKHQHIISCILANLLTCRDALSAWMLKKQSWPSWKMSRSTVSRMSRISPSRTWTKFSTTFFQPRPSSPPTGHRQPPRSTRNGFLRASFLQISGKLLFFRICLACLKMVWTVDIDEHHFQASYQRRSQREHFSVDSGWFWTTVWLSTRLMWVNEWQPL